MIKKLRIKFIIIIMAIVTLMLLVVFGLLYNFTKKNLADQSIGMMQSIAANPLANKNPYDSGEEVHLPYLTVQLGTHGEILATGGGYFDLSDVNFLNTLINYAASSDKDVGIIEEYNLRFCKVNTLTSPCYVFADMTSEKTTLQGLLKTSILTGILAFVIFFIISFLLSKWIVKPVDMAWKQQRQFVADASHELKTPLTVITTNAELIQNPVYDGGEKENFAGNILTMSHQMRELVERLLMLARSDNNQNKLSFSFFDYSTCVNNSLLVFEPLIFERGLTLTSTIADNISVNGDESALRQVTEILLDNAQKYASEKGCINVILKSPAKGRCCLEVSNTGEPIDAADLKNIFRRFYRADKARTTGGGFGLGLSIAENIVTAHNGKIHAESAGGMNKFIVELPAGKLP